MSEVSATDAARRFADLLDSVEHDGQRYTIMRHGKAVAQIEPVTRGRGSDAKRLLRQHRPDTHWARELDQVRNLLEVEDRT
jgi:prevent-host-death family protein